MCLLPSALRTQRTAAAQLLGLNKLQSRSMAFALAPNAKYHGGQNDYQPTFLISTPISGPKQPGSCKRPPNFQKMTMMIFLSELILFFFMHER